MAPRRHARVLGFDFTVNTLLTVVEVGAALWTGSIALRADSLQNLTDSVVLTISYLAERAASRPRLTRRALAQIDVKTAMVNAVILNGIALYALMSAIERILAPHPLTNAPLVVEVGLLAIFVNLLAAAFLFAHRLDRAMEAPFVGLLFSGLSGVGVCLSGVGAGLRLGGSVDGWVGLGIACLLLVRASWMLRVRISEIRHAVYSVAR